MTLHWWYVTFSWAGAAIVFLALTLGAALRHAAARRRLLLLDTRPGGRRS